MQSACGAFVWQLGLTELNRTLLELNRKPSSFCYFPPDPSFLLASIHPWAGAIQPMNEHIFLAQDETFSSSIFRDVSSAQFAPPRANSCLFLSTSVLHFICIMPKICILLKTFTWLWQQSWNYSYIMWVLIWHHMHWFLPEKVSHRNYIVTVEKIIQKQLIWRLAACYQSGCLKIKGNHFPAESGHWWIANDEMTRMSVNWMFDAGSNWMRGRELWKANTLWSVLFHDMLYSLVDVW